jgi:hypothetical protein
MGWDSLDVVDAAARDRWVLRPEIAQRHLANDIM